MLPVGAALVAAAGWIVGLGGMGMGVSRGIWLGGMDVSMAAGGRGVALGGTDIAAVATGAVSPIGAVGLGGTDVAGFLDGADPGKTQLAKSITKMTDETKIEPDLDGKTGRLGDMGHSSFRIKPA